MLTEEVLTLIAKAREKTVDPVTRTGVDEFHDLLDSALSLCDLTDTEIVKELIEVLPGGFHRTELRVLLHALMERSDTPICSTPAAKALLIPYDCVEGL